MAKEPKDAVVELEEEGVVTIDVSDNPDLIEDTEKEEEEGEGEVEVEAKPEPKKPLPRVRLNEQKTVNAPAVDEAATALREAADRRVAAAEATATAERLRRETAERMAAKHLQEADDARASAEETHLTLLDNGIEAAGSEVKSAKTQLKQAMEAGNFDEAAEAQAVLSKASAKLDRLEAAKADAATGVRKAPTTEGRVETPSQQSNFERYLSQFTPEAQNWLRLHPECALPEVGGNAVANSKMMAGHYAALSQNMAAGTPDYYRVIEEHTGHRQPVSTAAAVTKAGEEEEAAPAPKAKPRLQPSAPPSREPASARGGLPPAQRTVTLTKDQQEMAKMSFPNMTPQQAFATYARNMIELEAEGKLGRTTH